MNEFSAPIVQQPRLVLIMPVGIVIAAVVGANLVWFIARSAGVPTAVGGAVALICLLAGIALAIASSVGAQGAVRVDQDARLEVDPRWRASRAMSLADATVRRYIWRRGGATMLLVGVYVEVGDGRNRITIGASDPALAVEYEQAGAEATTIPPSVTLAPADYRTLDALLQAGRATAGSD